MESHSSDFIFRQQMRELNDALLEKSARLARQAGCPVDQEATSTLRLLARGSASAFDPPFATSSPLAIYSRPSAATHSRHAGAPPPPPHHEAESRADDLWKAFFSPTLLDSAARVDAGDALVLSAAGHATTSSPGGARQLALRPKAGGAETTGGMLDAHTTPFGALNAAERYQGFLGSALPRGDLTRLQRALVLARLELVAAAERATGRVEPRPQDSASPPAAEDHRITERAWANVLADLRAMALAAEEAQRAARAQASRSPSAPASVSAAAPRAVDDAMRVLAARPGEQALYEDFGTAAAKTAADGRRWIKADGERADPEQADSGAEAKRRYEWLRLRHDTNAALLSRAQEAAYVSYLVSDDKIRTQQRGAAPPSTPGLPIRGDAVGGSAGLARQVREALTPGLAVPLAARRMALAVQEMHAGT